jgi:hypothetical protein
MNGVRELRNGAAVVGVAWLAFMISSILWLPIVAVGVDRSLAEPQGMMATGIRSALGLIGGALAGLATGYLLESAWMSRWRFVCGVLVGWQYGRITSISRSVSVDPIVTFMPGVIAGLAAFVAFPLGRRLLGKASDGPAA